MGVIKSGASADLWKIDNLSKAGRVTPYTSAGREITPQSKATYSCAATFTPGATPGDLVTIFGSNTKITQVVSIVIVTTNTAAGSQQFYLAKRSSPSTGGTFVAATPVSFDSTDPAATANVGHYTANPTEGTLTGNTNIMRVASPVAVPGSFAGIVEDAGKEMVPWILNSLLDKPITLRSTQEGVVVHFARAALVAGQTHAYHIVWTEE